MLPRRRWQGRTENIHVVAAADCFFLFLDFHTVKVGNLALDRLDCFVVVDTLNVQIDDNPVFRVHEVGKHTVEEFRRDDLQKGNCAKLARPFETFARRQIGKRTER